MHDPRPASFFSAALLTWMVWATLILASPFAHAEADGDGAAAPAETTDPAWVVVEIGADASASGPPKRIALGFVYEIGGYVLTAYDALVDPADGRLVADGAWIRVRVARAGQDWRSAPAHPARIIGLEPTLGLAIVQAEGLASHNPARLQRSGGLEEGLAVTAPGSLDTPRLTRLDGVLSGLNSKECYQESLAATLFRVALPLEPETQLGAPISNTAGEVIAIYTGAEPESLPGHVDASEDRHVLPVVLAQNIYESLKHKQSQKSPWTGFSVRSLSEAERSVFPTAKGFRSGIGIEYVWPGSPAEKMGVQVGDILLQFAHNRIASVADFQKWLYMYGVDSAVNLVFLREGEHLVTRYTIEERPGWAKPK